MRRAVASILQAFLRTDRDISLQPRGRRCLADHHLRTWCPPNKPPRVSSGSGESWFEPTRGIRLARELSDRYQAPAELGWTERRLAHRFLQSGVLPNPDGIPGVGSRMVGVSARRSLSHPTFTFRGCKEPPCREIARPCRILALARAARGAQP